MTAPERGDRAGGHSVGDVFRVVARKRTYKHLCYLLLAIPLGVVYYTLLFLGLGIGTVLLLVAVGIPILIGTVFGSRLLAAFERWLANALLELDLRTPDDVRSASGGGPGASIRRYLDAPSTWRGLGFLIMKAWIGVVALILLFVLATVVDLLTSPLEYPAAVEFGTVNERPITWTIDTLPELAVAVSLGIGLGLVFLHVVNAFAYVVGRIAVALLDGSDESDSSAGAATDAAAVDGMAPDDGT